MEDDQDQAPDETPNRPAGPLRANKRSVLAHLVAIAEHPNTKAKEVIGALAEIAKIKGMVTKKSEISMTVKGSVMLVPFCDTPEQWSALATAHDKRLRDEVKAAPLPMANDTENRPPTPLPQNTVSITDPSKKPGA